MKKNKFVTLCVIAALPFATATAQTPGDLLNLSQYNYSFGTARSAALGGAFTSLGADLSSMNINPAGLGIYRGSEVGISPSLTWSNMESGFQGRSNDYSRTRFSLGNVGAALNLYQGTGALTSFTLGVGYTKLADFNTTSAAYGQGIGQSMTEVFAEDIRGVSESTLRMTPEDPISPFQSLAIGQWGGILAYNTYVLDPVGDNYYAPWNNLSKDARINPSLYNINKGSIGEYDISGGFNFQNILYLGFTVGIQDIYFRNENNYSETYSNNTLPLNRLNYIRTLRQDGTGVNFKFGAILRPVDNLRIGVAVHTPTYVSMNEEYTEYMSAEFNTQQNWQESPYAPNQYNINTPTRLLTGISFTLPGVGLITADYERVWYDNMKIRNMNGNNWEFEQDLNQDIKSFFQPANNFRVGVEATPLKTSTCGSAMPITGSASGRRTPSSTRRTSVLTRTIRPAWDSVSRISTWTRPIFTPRTNTLPTRCSTSTTIKINTPSSREPSIPSRTATRSPCRRDSSSKRRPRYTTLPEPFVTRSGSVSFHISTRLCLIA